MNALGIDIGGSAIKGAPVDTRNGKLLAERHRIEVDAGISPAAMAKAVGARSGLVFRASSKGARSGRRPTCIPASLVATGPVSSARRRVARWR
jgi:hypothetical protein